jgi:hypothetical protein
MAEIRETHIERDADGNVVDTKVVEHHRRRGGGFGWGLILGALLIAVGIIAFAYSQGSFQQAGVEADQATAQIEQQADSAVETTGDAIENAGDQAEAVGDNAEQAANETSDTATN